MTRDQLDLIQVPEATGSYVPVSHYHLADKLLGMSTDILRDYALVGEEYAVARQGNQLFAVLKFRKDNADMALSIAFRNSYDRSMSLGIAIGATVFVCDNPWRSMEISSLCGSTPRTCGTSWKTRPSPRCTNLKRASTGSWPIPA